MFKAQLRNGAWLAGAASVTMLATLMPARAGGFDFSDLEFSAGGVGFVSPTYQGSKSYEFTAIPFAFPGSKDGADDLMFNDLDSIQYRFIKYENFGVGVLGGVWVGRSQRDGEKLLGLGDIDPGLVVGGFADAKFGYTTLTASYHQQVTGDEDVGALVRFRADAEVPISPGVRLLAGVGTNYGSDRYMDKNFGISAAQAATSLAHLAQHEPGAGFKDVFAGLGTEVDLTDRWTAKLYGEYSRLVGEAASSPLIETRDQFNGVLALTYQFGPLAASAPAAK
jgi:outer membrane scaffolding protein for murein synthesis (MipA/OmpV family)